MRWNKISRDNNGRRKIRWRMMRFLEDGGRIERIPESRSVKEELDDDTDWEDKDFVKNGNRVSSNTT